MNGGGTGSSSSDVFATPTEEFSQSPVVEHDFQPQKSVAFSMPYSSVGSNQRKIIAFKVKHLEMTMVQRTYDLKVALKLGAVTLDQFRWRNEQERVLNVIQTPKYDNNDDYLFTVHYNNCKKNSPEFATKYESVEQEVAIDFSTLLLLLHEDALNELIQLANDFQVRMEAVAKKQESDSTAQQPKDHFATIHEEESAATALLNAARERLPTILEDDGIVTSSSNKGKLVVLKFVPFCFN
uniref:Uncharacterized protein n=1 Tax=Anopheles maculatus TaxID=74869 RepID=A0A182T9X8_9DIPT